MKPIMSVVGAVASLVCAILAPTSPALSQTYPDHSIRMTAAFPPGGPTDGVTRVIAHALGERLGQTVVVENRGGAGGTLGAATVAKSAPDGYTLLMSPTGPLGYYRSLYKSLGYDPMKDLVPIALIGTIPQVIVASPKLPVTTLKDFIAYAKAHPGKVNIGDSGVGTSLHILAAQMAMKTGAVFQNVHYRGASASVADVLGGQIEAALSGFIPSYASMKVLGVTWTERMKALPDVPTFRESGIDIVSGLSLSLAAPAATPQPIVDKLNAAVNDFLKGPGGRDFESKYSLQIAGGTSQDAREFLAKNAEQLEAVIKAAHITAD